MNRSLLLSNIVALIVGVSSFAYIVLAAMAQGFSSASGQGGLTQLSLGWVLAVPIVSILSIILSRTLSETPAWIWAVIPMVAALGFLWKVQALRTQYSNEFLSAMQDGIAKDERRLKVIGLKKLFICRECAYEQFLSYDEDLHFFVQVISQRPGLSFSAIGRKNGTTIEIFDKEIMNVEKPFKDYLDESGKSIHDYYELKLSKEPQIYLDQIKKYQ